LCVQKEERLLREEDKVNFIIFIKNKENQVNKKGNKYYMVNYKEGFQMFLL